MFFFQMNLEHASQFERLIAKWAFTNRWAYAGGIHGNDVGKQISWCLLPPNLA